MWSGLTITGAILLQMGRVLGKGRPWGLDLVVRRVSSLRPGVFSLMLQATPTRIPPRSFLPRPGLLGLLGCLSPSLGFGSQ